MSEQHGDDMARKSASQSAAQAGGTTDPTAIQTDEVAAATGATYSDAALGQLRDEMFYRILQLERQMTALQGYDLVATAVGEGLELIRTELKPLRDLGKQSDALRAELAPLKLLVPNVLAQPLPDGVNAEIIEVQRALRRPDWDEVERQI